nr:hypothetical protein [Tanacetum cinerariifolium]
LDAVASGLNAEGGRGTGNVHVETEALHAECRLNLDGNRGVRPLQVGTGDDHAVDVGCGFARAMQGLLGGRDTHLAKDRPLVVGALRQTGLHALRVEDAVFVHDE